MKERNESIRAALALRIRDRRREIGLSRSDVAVSAGLAVGNYYQLERGDGNPTVTTLLKLAHGLQIDPGELVRGLGPCPVSPRVLDAPLDAPLDKGREGLVESRYEEAERTRRAHSHDR